VLDVTGEFMVNFQVTLNHEGRLPDWSQPETSKYGLYIFRSSGVIIRIGESSSACARLSKGFNQPLRHVRRGKERKNYLAYSWRERHANKSIAVDYFNLADTPFSDNFIRRSLEAEITFQVRVQAGHWPTEMSEIHFLESHRNDPSVVSEAQRVLSHYGYTYRGDI
jgi:hypothetical protein